MMTVKKEKKRDYDSEILDAKFEIAVLNWAKAEEIKEIKKKKCVT